MDHWWDEIRWLRRHALLAPFGVFAATLLLTWQMEQWQWHGGSSWALAVTLVDMGAVLYGMAAVAVERSVKLMFFWAWDQYKKARAQVREEGRKQGIEQGREQGLEQGIEQGLEQGREQARQESAAQIRELQDRLSELESHSNDARRERPNRRPAARRRLAG